MLNLIFVCDKCLAEYKIPNNEFNPYGSTKEMLASGWSFPESFIKYVDERYGYRTLSASSVICLCPDCQ